MRQVWVLNKINQVAQLWWLVSDTSLMPSFGVFLAYPTGRKLQDRSRTCWSDYISHMDWYQLHSEQELWKENIKHSYIAADLKNLMKKLLSLSCRTKKLCRVCGEVGSGRRRAAHATSKPEPTSRDYEPAEKSISCLPHTEPTSVQQQPHPELTGVSHELSRTR